jgi:membrane associated rhomboid family serine protease
MTNSGDGHDGENPWGNSRGNSEGSSGGKNSPNDKSNIISLKAARDKKQSSKKDIPPQNTPPENKEPLFNLPPYTTYMLATFIGIHIIVSFLLSASQTQWAILNIGFIPGRFTGFVNFEALALVTPFTHMLLHGGWLHLAMNCVMLLAFGSGVERWIGGKKMIAFFVVCGLFGIAAHFALNHQSINPVIGASGGLSGLFTLALVMINRMQNNSGGGRQKIWPFVLLWIGISVLFGSMGGPGGSEVAWAAHVGGFLGGFVVLKWMKL